MQITRVVGLGILTTLSLLAQPVAWRVNALAGNFPLGNEGPALQAILGTPRGLTIDRNGNIYVADTGNHQIRRISRDGRITAVAGSGVRGNSGDGGPALTASLYQPGSVAIDGNNLYIADSGNLRVRVVNLTTGVIENYAGRGVSGSDGDGGPAGGASFRSVVTIAVDSQGNLLISDTAGHKVRRVTKATGIISTFAGTGTAATAGDGAQASQAPLAFPDGLAFDDQGNTYIANAGNGRILRVDGNGVLRRVAGSLANQSLSDGVPAIDAFMAEPTGLAVDSAKKRLYVTDYTLDTVRVISLETGLIETVAGTAFRTGPTGDGGAARTALLGGPWAMALDTDGSLVFTEVDSNRIRKVDPTGIINTIAGRRPFAGDGGPATSAILFNPSAAIGDGQGGWLIADTGNCVIRRVDRGGGITTVVGRAGQCASSTTNPPDPALALEALLRSPQGLARDRRGNIYISEGPRIRRWSAEDGRVTIFARGLSGPAGLAFDANEEYLYVAESNGNRVTRIQVLTGTASVFAGPTGGSAGFAGDGGVAADARFSFPNDVAVDRNGNVFVADGLNNRIRRIEAGTLRVSTVAGNGRFETADGPALTTGLALPSGLAIDADGTLYTASGYRVVQITPGQGSTIRTIAGGTAGGLSGDGGFGPDARFNLIVGLRLEGQTLLVFDTLNHRIRTLTQVRANTLALVSGNNQSAAVSARTANPLVVQVRLADGAPVSGVPVAFRASAGTIEASVTTGRDGNAQAFLTMPAAAGPVTVTATVEGLTPVTFTLTATPQVTVTRPTISSVITAGAFGAAARVAPGSWIEIYGTNFGTATLQWAGEDFSADGTAPTTLGGVRVTVGGRAAFVQLVTPGQINALVPDGIATGPVPVVVTTASASSEPFTVEAAGRAPALLAPGAFASAGTQYVVATFPDGVFAGPPELIAGAPFRRAKAGDRLVMYGVGFGPTVPALPSGRIVGQVNSLPNLAVRIGGRDAVVEYGGLAGGFVGLYQFNVVVPAGVTGDVALEVTVDGVTLGQRLFVAVE